MLTVIFRVGRERKVCILLSEFLESFYGITGNTGL